MGQETVVSPFNLSMVDRQPATSSIGPALLSLCLSGRCCGKYEAFCPTLHSFALIYFDYSC